MITGAFPKGLAMPVLQQLDAAGAFVNNQALHDFLRANSTQNAAGDELLLFSPSEQWLRMFIGWGFANGTITSAGAAAPVAPHIGYLWLQRAGLEGTDPEIKPLEVIKQWDGSAYVEPTPELMAEAYQHLAGSSGSGCQNGLCGCDLELGGAPTIVEYSDGTEGYLTGQWVSKDGIVRRSRTGTVASPNYVDPDHGNAAVQSAHWEFNYTEEEIAEEVRKANCTLLDALVYLFTESGQAFKEPFGGIPTEAFYKAVSLIVGNLESDASIELGGGDAGDSGDAGQLRIHIQQSTPQFASGAGNAADPQVIHPDAIAADIAGSGIAYNATTKKLDAALVHNATGTTANATSGAGTTASPLTARQATDALTGVVELTGSAQMPAEKTRDDSALTPAGAAKLVGYLKPVASTGALNAAQLSADAIEVPMFSNFSCNAGTRGAPRFTVPVAGGESCAIDLGALPYLPSDYAVPSLPAGWGSGIGATFAATACTSVPGGMYVLTPHGSDTTSAHAVCITEGSNGCVKITQDVNNVYFGYATSTTAPFGKLAALMLAGVGVTWTKVA